MGMATQRGVQAVEVGNWEKDKTSAIYMYLCVCVCVTLRIEMKLKNNDLWR